MASTQDVFIRKSSGLTRQISARDALMYCTQNPGPLYALMYAIWAPAFYPGASMPLAVCWVLLMFPIAGLYWYFSVSMPRSGGEYVYVSRTLHPSLGLWASFMISITAVSWTGTIQDWWMKWGLNDMIRSIGIARQNQGLIHLANTMDGQWVRFFIGTFALALTGYLFLLGTKAMMRVSYWAVGMAWLAVIILGVLVVVTGKHGFERNFSRLSGTDVQTIIQAGKHAGAIFQIGFLATLYAGVTWVNLNTLGQTFSANLAGEIRGVGKSQALALFGALTIQMAAWFAIYSFIELGFGRDFMQSITALWNAGSDQYPALLAHANPHVAGEPMPQLLLAFLTGNPFILALFGICFIVATWISLAGLAFAPIRNVFAWSFDRLVPTKLSEIRTRYRAPVGAIVVVILTAFLFHILEIFFPSTVAAVAFTIIAWFLGWIVLGIAGMVYPYRRKEMFEAGPPSTQRRIGGIPVISILGFLTLAVSVFTEWAVGQAFFSGSLEFSQYAVVGVMAAIPIVIYVWAHNYHKRKGIPLSLQFSQVPPE